MFREGSVVVECLQEFADERPDLHVDVVLVNGGGEWCMRSFGLTCYVGFETEIPPHTGKSVQSEAQTECQNVRDFMMLEHVLDDRTPIAN
jgi:hypothetical protein